MAGTTDINNQINQLQGIVQNIQTAMGETDTASAVDMSSVTSALATAISAAQTILTNLGSGAAVDEGV